MIKGQFALYLLSYDDLTVFPACLREYRFSPPYSSVREENRKMEASEKIMQTTFT
jgi:hypothetical protein